MIKIVTRPPLRLRRTSPGLKGDEIRRKTWAESPRSVKSTVGRGPGLAHGDLYRRTRSGYRPRASAEQITKAMKSCPLAMWRMVAAAQLRKAQVL